MFKLFVERMMSFTWFDEVENEEFLGRKALNVSQLHQSKFLTPTGFIIPPSFFQDYANQQEVSEEFKTILSQAHSKMNVAGRDYSGLGKKALELIGAGRDLPTLTIRVSTQPEVKVPGFPLLNVKSDELVESVTGAWDKVLQPEVIRRLEERGVNPEEVSVSLIVQKMVNTDASGVAYTKNPVSGEPVIIVEAVWGFGTGLSRGELTPDHYEVDPSTMRVVNKSVKEQEWMYGKDFVTGDIIKKPLSNSKANSQVIGDDKIIEVARLAKKLSGFTNKDQSLCWGVDDNRLFVFDHEELEVEDWEGEDESERSGKSLVCGEAASPGVVSGKAVIIRSEDDLKKVEGGSVLVARNALNSMSRIVEKSGGVIVEEGGMSSDIASLCRQLSKPCVTGVENASNIIKHNQLITLNGFNGKIFSGVVEAKELDEEPILEQSSYTDYEPSVDHEPSETRSIKAPNHSSKIIIPEPRVEEYEPEISEPSENHPKLPERTWEPEEVVTATSVYLNLNHNGELEKVHDKAHDGVGLLKLDKAVKELGRHPNWLMYHKRGGEYAEAINDHVTSVARMVQPKPVFVSFTDLQSSKMRGLKGGEDYEPEEANPLMGWRGASRHVHKNFEQAFRLECRAVKEARDKGFTNVHAIIPFARNVKDVKQALRIMSEEGLDREDGFQVKVSVDSPSILFSVKDLKNFCDGLCVNLNTLSQTLFAQDAENELVEPKQLETPLLRAVDHLVSRAHEHGLEVTVCTNMVKGKELLKKLIEMGVDSISANPLVSRNMKKIVEFAERQIMLKKLRG